MFFGQAALFFLLLETFTIFLVIGKIGFFKTFFLWLCTAALGALVIQRQGIAALMRAQGILNRSAVPVGDLFDSLCMIVGGLLLLLPGFISDGLAVLLFIPFIRRGLKKKYPDPFTARTGFGAAPDDSVIDGTYVRVKEIVDVIEQKSSRTPSSRDL